MKVNHLQIYNDDKSFEDVYIYFNGDIETKKYWLENGEVKSETTWEKDPFTITWEDE